MQIIQDVILKLLIVTEIGIHVSRKQDEDQLVMVLSCYGDNGNYQ